MKNFNKKGQAAIEFMVTYGWAIMAAMIVIGALTYFGMTNPATSLPDKCVFSNAFACKDYQMNPTAVKVTLTNIYGQSLWGPITAACTDDTTSTCTCTVSPAVGAGATLDPENEINVTCNNPPDYPFNTKEKAKVKISVNYQKTNGGYSQVSLGEIYATVQ